MPLRQTLSHLPVLRMPRNRTLWLSARVVRGSGAEGEGKESAGGLHAGDIVNGTMLGCTDHSVMGGVIPGPVRKRRSTSPRHPIPAVSKHAVHIPVLDHLCRVNTDHRHIHIIQMIRLVFVGTHKLRCNARKIAGYSFLARPCHDGDWARLQSKPNFSYQSPSTPTLPHHSHLIRQRYRVAAWHSSTNQLQPFNLLKVTAAVAHLKFTNRCRNEKRNAKRLADALGRVLEQEKSAPLMNVDELVANENAKFCMIVEKTFSDRTLLHEKMHRYYLRLSGTSSAIMQVTRGIEAQHLHALASDFAMQSNTLGKLASIRASPAPLPVMRGFAWAMAANAIDVARGLPSIIVGAAAAQLLPRTA
ncbi:hypothetical protein BD410DRAFT_808662 [Rickenella mellea]|uniref:Uncharacterized protein n=1 Tax=Rickenella mellea TaxID=50990 RepID=A0A4Y7PMS1_9AGAM|nr:hypothetical protein BD410DRAFT_808662 [Rickenella mellea]